MEKIKLLFAGDFCIRGAGVGNLDDETISRVSAPIAEKTGECDISVVNVETVFTDVLSPVKNQGLRFPLP